MQQLVKCNINEDKVYVLPPLIDRSVFYPRSRHNSVNDLGLDSKYTYCSYIGHFTAAKGVEDLIVAFARVAQVHENVKLVLAWSGYGSKRNIERLIAEHNISNRIVWMGKTDVAKLLGVSEMVVLPYRNYVGTTYPPNLVLEALCCGTPIVSTHVGCIPEFVRNGETGMLAPIRNPEGLNNAMLNLLNDDELKKEISVGQLDMSENLDTKRNIKRYIELIQQVADNEGR
jgi:glycosyltransferase involved in cell wall biosynthesis